ncbi:chorismate-binding protein [Pleomorphovibrio marinus]|uniref:chorismate-binding protein n=1 Tax=Pleomorphovibrio marinus TaxID=2164132 RepID=UPI000E0BA41E|nr:chorismate-binding protein [Pleomorphovibrio marinus]
MELSIGEKGVQLKEYLANLLAYGLAGDHQIALWRRPKEKKVEIILDNEAPTWVNPTIEDLPSGFLLHPFQETPEKKALLIQAKNYYSLELDQPALSIHEEGPWPNKEIGPAKLEELLVEKTGIRNKNSQSGNHNITRKADFLKTVNKGVEAIEKGELFKVVPAKVKSAELPGHFDLVATLLHLFEAYPNSFVNFFHIPQVGTWVGATPEVLIQTKENFFYTMSLAGTQKAKGDNPIKTAGWTQKEIEEQAMVSRYIVNCFKKIRLREYDEIGPKTSLAGELLHLRSDFKVDMDATNFPQLGSVMLDLLHPTSAVCGMPKEKALEFIATHEKFDRSFFAGYLGPVNIQQETALFVNLRCAQFQGKRILLYAGAGVTADSEPDQEWEETELKCDVIGKHLKTRK